MVFLVQDGCYKTTKGAKGKRGLARRALVVRRPQARRTQACVEPGWQSRAASAQIMFVSYLWLVA